MKFLFVCLLAMLSGCWQVVNEADIRRAAVVCSSYEFIEEITADFLGDEYVKCRGHGGVRLIEQRIR